MTPKPPAAGDQLSAQLLIDLVTNTLDPGYAAAARVRGHTPPRRWSDRPALAVGCVLIGFTLVVAYSHTNRGAPEAAKVHNDLVSRVRAAQHEVQRLSAQAQQLNSALTALRDQALSGDATLSRQLDRDQLLAGQTAAVGPGLQVVLTEPPRTSASAPPRRGGPAPGDVATILTDRDVRSVVNELWADGAEAISVNDVRLTPTSAIRFAGNAVLVDFAPVTTPFTIRAIGNADVLATNFASSAVASRYKTLAGADGIGFDFTEHAKLTLPASPATAPRIAHRPSRTATPLPTPTLTRTTR
ncbi:MAG: hypothetical protein DLM57_18645 [Pseudonocardiales bacterium]|nr:MAG: hypothetical protein DLM57_18645 [Pseudonocardiales bacterium]